MEPEERVILAVDFASDILDLTHIVRDLGSRVRSIKLGQGFLLHENAWSLHKYLMAVGTETALDAKYEEDPDQMGPVVAASFSKGFRHVSVAPAAGAASLLSAARAVSEGGSLFAALPSNDEELLEKGMHNIQYANTDLDDEQKVQEVMCNVRDIERVKSMGNFTVIATGIRLPGDDPYDQPHIASPAEALSRGADYLAIGRSITAKKDKIAAFEQVLENAADCL